MKFENIVIEILENNMSISTEQFPKEFCIDWRQRVSRRILSQLFGISEPTIRNSFDIPAFKGARGEPTKYQANDVTEHLMKLNQGLDDVWSKQYLSTRDAAAFISGRLNYSVSENMLAKYRETAAGPIFMRVTHRTIRYRIENLEIWIQQRRQIDKCCNGLQVEKCKVL
jgi:hypothetical protein